MCGSMEKAHTHIAIISIANVINSHFASVREHKRRLFQTLYTFGNETTILVNRKTIREYAVSSTNRILVSLNQSETIMYETIKIGIGVM